jgi:Lipocalin-like domain
MSTIGNDPSKIIIPSSPWIIAPGEEIAEVARYLMSYWGAYKIFEEEGEVRLSTKVHVALDPSWLGTMQERKAEFRIEDGRQVLVLKPVKDLPAPVS